MYHTISYAVLHCIIITINVEEGQAFYQYTEYEQDMATLNKHERCMRLLNNILHV